MTGPIIAHDTLVAGSRLPCDPEDVLFMEERRNGTRMTRLSVWYVPEGEETAEETLRKLHDRFTTLESAVEDAVNDLRAGVGREGRLAVANDLEAALEQRGEGWD